MNPKRYRISPQAKAMAAGVLVVDFSRLPNAEQMMRLGRAFDRIIEASDQALAAERSSRVAAQTRYLATLATLRRAAEGRMAYDKVKSFLRAQDAVLGTMRLRGRIRR